MFIQPCTYLTTGKHICHNTITGTEEGFATGGRAHGPHKQKHQKKHHQTHSTADTGTKKYKSHQKHNKQ